MAVGVRYAARLLALHIKPNRQNLKETENDLLREVFALQHDTEINEAVDPSRFENRPRLGIEKPSVLNPQSFIGERVPRTNVVARPSELLAAQVVYGRV